VRALENIVERHSVARILSVGGVLAVVPLAGTWAAVGWADVALGAVAATMGAATAAAAATRARLDRLPLELAPRVAVGRVDGREVVRLRACLGRGRACRPRWTVRFHPTDGVPRRVEAFAPVDHVCGPFVAQIEAPAEPGELEVEVAAGDQVARATYSLSEAARGRFTGGIEAGRRVRFDEGWREVGGPLS